MSTHDQLSLIRFDARSSVLSLLVLHFVNLGLRSFLTGIEYRAEGDAWRASNQEFYLMFLLQLLQSFSVLSRSVVPELSVVTSCCQVDDES